MSVRNGQTCKAYVNPAAFDDIWEGRNAVCVESWTHDLAPLTESTRLFVF